MDQTWAESRRAGRDRPAVYCGLAVLWWVNLPGPALARSTEAAEGAV
jgi:hypothetical protein